MKQLCLFLSLWIGMSSPVHSHSPVAEEAQGRPSVSFMARVKTMFARRLRTNSPEVVAVETKQVHMSSTVVADQRPVETVDVSSTKGEVTPEARAPIIIEEKGESTSAFSVNTNVPSDADTDTAVHHTSVVSAEEEAVPDISAISISSEGESFDVVEESSALTPGSESLPAGEVLASNTGEYESALFETEEGESKAEDELDDFDLAIKAAEMLSDATGVGKEVVGVAKDVASEVRTVLKVHQVEEALGDLGDIDVDTTRSFGEQFRQFLDRKVAGRYYNPKKYGAKRSGFAIFGPLAIGKGVEYAGAKLPIPGSEVAAKALGRTIQLGLDRVFTPGDANYSRPYSLYELGHLTHHTSILMNDVYAPTVSILTPEQVTDLARQAAISAVYYMDHQVRKSGKTIITEEDLLRAVGTRYVNLDRSIPSFKTIKTSIKRRLKFWDRKKRLTARQSRYLLTSTPGMMEGQEYAPYKALVPIPENWKQWLLMKLKPKFQGRTLKEGLFLKGRVYQDQPGTLKKSNIRRGQFRGAYRKVNPDYVKRTRMRRVR